MKVQWTDVDGVPTIYAEAGQVHGPLHACLMFGTGRCDETLRNSGINHLVEHLVFHTLEATPYTWNGEVNPVTTRFWAMGGPDQIVEFFSFITRQLRELPLDRLDAEMRVLEIEGQRRGGSRLGADLAERFGPHGPGIVAWPEYGLRRFEAEEIQQWAQDRFTVQNAVLWLNGPIPEQLHLGDLPVGEPIEHPPTPASFPPARAFIAIDSPRVSVSFLSERQWGVSPALNIVQQRAHDRLRRDAVSYSVEYTRILSGNGTAVEYVEADGAEGALAQVMRELVKVIDELASSGPTPEELSTFRQFQRQFADHPQWIEAFLESTARARVFGEPVHTPDDVDAALDELTPSSVREDLEAIIPTMLAIGPEDTAEHLEGWTMHSDWSNEGLEGTTYQPIAGRERGTLVLGADGIVWTPDDRHHRTIRWDDVEACLTFDNGKRIVMANSGATVAVTPWHWQSGHDLPRLVDAAVDPQRYIRLGEGQTVFRDPDFGGSETDVRWLASLVGASDSRERMDVVIDSDGVFLLFGGHGWDDRPRRHEVMRASDRETLLAVDRRNRWIAESQIEMVKLRKRPLAWLGLYKGSVTMRLRNGEKVGFYLTTDQQFNIAAKHFPRLLGARFQQ